MRLETERLIIRDIVPDDIEAMYDMYRRPEVHTYLGPASKPPESLDDYRDWFAKLQERLVLYPDGQGGWAITLKADPDRFIGLALLKPLPDDDRIEIGWHIHPELQGQGIATEWAQAGLKYGFETLGLQTIWCILIGENSASRRVAEKIGMIHAGQTDMYHGLTLELFSLDRP